MKLTVYNPQKGQLETISLDITADNTTWFDNCVKTEDIAMITDFNGDLVITSADRRHPVRINQASRRLVRYNQNLAKKLQRDALR